MANVTNMKKMLIREMQIKNAMSYHGTLVKIVTIKKTKDNKCCKDVEKNELYTLNQNLNSTDIMNNSVQASQKTKNGTTM